MLLHPEASAQHSGDRADASRHSLAIRDGEAESMKPAHGQGQNVLKSIQACDEYVLDPLELEVMGMLSLSGYPIIVHSALASGTKVARGSTIRDVG